MRREGITLWGKKYLKALATAEVRDIGADRYFAYLSSSMKEFIQNFDPVSIFTKSNSEGNKNLDRDAAKAILDCGEIYGMTSSHYETRTKIWSHNCHLGFAKEGR